jgi:hypothetical protein
MASRTIELLSHEPSDMMYLLVDGEREFTGNTWDFHAGCQGTHVAGYELAGLWDKGAQSLAGVLKLKMGADGHDVTLTEREISDAENDRLL